jgi:hypothetical protein
MEDLPDMERLSERYIDYGETFWVTPIARYWCINRGTLTVPAAMGELDPERGRKDAVEDRSWSGEPGTWGQHRTYLFRQHGAMDLTLTLIESSLLSFGTSLLMTRSEEDETGWDWKVLGHPEDEDRYVEEVV